MFSKQTFNPCWPGVAGSCHGRSHQVWPEIRCEWRNLAVGGRASSTAAFWQWAAAWPSTPACSAADTGTEPENRPPSMYMSQVRHCCPSSRKKSHTSFLLCLSFKSLSLSLSLRRPTILHPYAYCLYPQVKQDAVGAKYRPIPESQLYLNTVCPSNTSFYMTLAQFHPPPSFPASLFSAGTYLPVV